MAKNEKTTKAPSRKEVSRKGRHSKKKSSKLKSSKNYKKPYRAQGKKR